MLYVIIIILLLSVAINALLFVALRNNLIKVEKYESWVISILDDIQNTYVKLKEVDDKEMFEKDDDVGFVFKSILDIIDELNKKIR